jgi:hypothetical protein
MPPNGARQTWQRSVRGRLFLRQERGGSSSSTTEYYIAGNLRNYYLSQLVLYASAIRFISSKASPSLITFCLALVRPCRRLLVARPLLAVARLSSPSQPIFWRRGRRRPPSDQRRSTKIRPVDGEGGDYASENPMEKTSFRGFTSWNGACERGATGMLIHPHDDNFEAGGPTEYCRKSL